jgi:hypothetical protein
MAYAHEVMRIVQPPAAVRTLDVQPVRRDQREQCGPPFDALMEGIREDIAASIMLRSKKIRSTPKRPLRYSCRARACPAASLRR